MALKRTPSAWTFGQGLLKHSRHDVGDAAGWVRHDEADRLGRPCLGGSGCAHDRGEGRDASSNGVAQRAAHTKEKARVMP
jgi:hypothetical protein